GQSRELAEFLKTVTKKLCSGFDKHSVFLTKEGHIYTRGLNSNGQLGLGDTINRYRNEDCLVPFHVQALKDIIDIEVGMHHTLCLDKDGHVYAFGDNKSGQLGLGDTENRKRPCLIKILENHV